MVNKSNLRNCLGIYTFLLPVAGLAQAATTTVGPGACYDFSTIQAGIDAADDGDTVLVASGDYVITEPITFRGKAIIVKSEDGPDKTTIRMGTPADIKRASVVVFENYETAASMLDGFTITGGGGLWESEYGTWGGGGIEFYASSGTVRNCAIVQNKVTTGGGGGVDCWHNSTPTVINCIIAGNSAQYGGGGLFCGQNSNVTVSDCVVRDNSSTEGGGGVGCWQNSLATLTNCIIRGNTSGGEGGGVACWENSTVTMTDCVIKSNKGYDYFGGGVYVGHSSATLTNCVVARNTIALGGGGVACSYPDASVTINNCTICGNSAGSEWGGGGVLCRNASATVTNSIIWGNTSPKGPEISVEDPASTLTVAYSDVAGGQAKAHVNSVCILNWGEGNIDANPLFAELGYWADLNDPNVVVESDDPNAIWIDGDYHLKSEVGRWDPYNESWIVDDVTSPCIDRGDPNSPVGDEPDPNGGIINMGAYGGTSEASMSIGQLPPLPPPIPLAHWKLDETEGDIAYDSAGVNDAFVIGDPLWQPTGGQVDGALQLDGIDDYISTPAILDPAEGDFSVFAWIKGGAPGQVAVSQEGGTSWLMADPADGGLRTDLRTPEVIGRNAKPAGPPLICPTVVTDGDWHRVGFVRDSSYRILYVDDIEVARDTAGTLEFTDAGLYIGASSALEPGSFFSGLIDDVCIYNAALSAEEIAAHVQQATVDRN